MCDEQAMKVIIDPVYRWTKRERGALTVHSVGDAAEVDVLLESLGGQGTPSSQRVAETLRRRRGQFSAIVTGPTLETSVPGVFAAGDVRAGSTKQVASAVGEGATAALMIRNFLEQRGDQPRRVMG